MAEINWYKAEENDSGIETIALSEIENDITWRRTVGYNGILKGDKVMYQDKEYTVVMCSRLGDFGLSETGELPYTMRVCPSEVKKIN